MPQCELTSKILDYDPKAETGLIDSAYELAQQAHSTQRRDNGEPYFTHPVAVANILAGYRLDVSSIATALLHDVVEDTPVKLTEIETRFGKEIAGLVDGVTKLTRLELQSDRTKQAENFRKLVLAMSRDIRVLLVKLADRLHNMRTLHFVREPDRRKRIARETMEIYAPLAERIGMDAVKTELQTLSFTQLEPEAYATIQARLNFLRGQGADVIDDVRRELIEVCREGGVEVISVTGREKSPYSIWEKMHRRNVAFEQLSDIMAFRIVVATKADCYAALGAVHSAYPVIAGRFKDYISTPKSNGYQSLHTGVTLRQPRNQKIEVQIRTEEMNDVAENGVASHWIYKAPEKKVDGSDVQRFRWVQDLLEILDDSAAPDEFLENTKLELYADQVFCFTPKGQLIQLPRGATPVDFGYAVHSQVGDTCVGAKVNGRLMPLRHHLENGDQVEIMTARGGTPSPQWDRFVVTGKARARIRRFIHQEQRQRSRDAGRVELTRAFRQAGVDGSEKSLEPALKALKVATVDDLYIAVGNSNIGPKDVVHAAYPELRQTPRAPRMVPQMLPRTGKPPTRHDHDMPVTGLVPGMAYSFAGCCHPVPGDEIVGIVTTGKGITIHSRDCQTLAAFAATPERFMDVDWNYESVGKTSANGKGSGHTARISVIAANEQSALADLANAIAKQEGAVNNLKIVNRQQDFMEILVDVDVRDLQHLSKVIVGLRGLKLVKGVERATGG
ncbi:RelA/SpoT family protein [Rhodopila globiformis]|uniref:GTP pyrophosphokinase rsh n=1 Tax=Rhodopila globiformis TaxID=1071 RepID=A0A2S6NJ00_RHOGL|nr:bifunctional (p)ppGpp synthetase/guanosine-3',5'-bis(diphosphate) 3'-pyrophosphohydrolase [Rhodopila globiformis]PPQ34539.1 bifunctional (p)ppGpp synthetase/guanosine-3',5'-bis(diphosphate) 3'-pyrophosphohydrolase [Rhodopila globiformis]